MAINRLEDWELEENLIYKSLERQFCLKESSILFSY